MSNDRELPETYCYFYAEGFDFDPDKITQLLEVEPKEPVIVSLGRECAVGVNCVGYFAGCNPGFDINPELLSRLAALKLTIGFDLYAISDDRDISP
jgi:hypothetical protein